MKLHRTGQAGDWVEVEPSQRNTWQRIAAATHGVVTPGNAVTLAGYGVFELGLRDIRQGKTASGMIKIMGARLFDLADGWVADATKTKSPTGEMLDATIDKIEAARGLSTLVAARIVPRSVGVAFAAQNTANTAATLMAKRRGNEIHPSAEGKITTALQWAAIGSYGIEACLRESGADSDAVAQLTGDALAVSATVLGTTVSAQYFQDALVD